MKKITSILIILILIIAIWYFGPCFFFKGSYSGTIANFGNQEFELTIIIDNDIQLGDYPCSYSIDPIGRRINIDRKIDHIHWMNGSWIRIGWNKISVPYSGKFYSLKKRPAEPEGRAYSGNAR